MCAEGTGGTCQSANLGPATVAEALQLAKTALDFLNSPTAAELPGSACGDALAALGELQGRLAAAHATFLRRFDAANAHDADGYGSSSAWLAARGRMTRRDALAAVRQMRQFSQRPGLHGAVAAGDLSRSWADAIARWTRKLPAEMRDETDKILLEAAAAGASLEDLATIAAAIERWRSTRPDPEDDFDFRDRHVRLGRTFGGAGVIRGDLTPECAAAVTAVLEALGKKQGPEDDRNQGQRFHDALAEACHLLLRARLVPGRAGADTQVIVHVPISQLRQMPGAADLEDAWLRARLGDPADPGTAYLTGKDAKVAACDALTIPVVTGHAGMSVIDKMIALASAGPGGNPAMTGAGPAPGGADQHCAWPGGCDRPAAASDVHHIRHKSEGGETSVHNCGLFCEFHHETCIHRWGWQITLHPDGTMEARSPDGKQVLSSHAPPTAHAA